jgi:hypothetical protein
MTLTGKLQYCDTNLSQCHSVNHKLHGGSNRGFRGED